MYKLVKFITIDNKEILLRTDRINYIIKETSSTPTEIHYIGIDNSPITFQVKWGIDVPHTLINSFLSTIEK